LASAINDGALEAERVLRVGRRRGRRIGEALDRIGVSAVEEADDLFLLVAESVGGRVGEEGVGESNGGSVGEVDDDWVRAGRVHEAAELGGQRVSSRRSSDREGVKEARGEGRRGAVGHVETYSRVATEESRARVKALVDELLHTRRHGREVGEIVGILTRALSGSEERSTVRPVVGLREERLVICEEIEVEESAHGIRRRVDGEDDVDLTGLGEEGSDGDVLSVLALWVNRVSLRKREKETREAHTVRDLKDGVARRLEGGTARLGSEVSEGVGVAGRGRKSVNDATEKIHFTYFPTSETASTVWLISVMALRRPVRMVSKNWV
jgi:hypothetical protein